MFYQEAEIEIKNQFSSNYSRKNFDAFLHANNLSFDFKGIHITGTNGKGSTSKFFYDILRDANYNVGIFTSPYFYNLRETIVFNDKEISEDEFVKIYEQYRDSILKFHLTEFEIQTLIAFIFFKYKNVDVAVIECGMGGSLDATNIFTPLLTVITSISIEHTMYLGTSVSDIALHKVGIFKEGVNALVGELNDEAMMVVRETCKNLKCPLSISKKDLDFERKENKIIFNYDDLKNIVLNTNASYQVKNASIAIEGCYILRKFFTLSDENIKHGLSKTPFPFRFENSARNILLDGAHNVEAVRVLVKELENIKMPIHIIFASFRDKNIETTLPLLSSVSNDLRITCFPHKRCRTKDEYFLYLDDYKFYEDYQKCFDEIKKEYPNDLILFTGSLAFCGFIKRNLKHE